MGTSHDEDVTNLEGCRIDRAFTVFTMLVLPAEPPISSYGGCSFSKRIPCERSFFSSATVAADPSSTVASLASSSGGSYLFPKGTSSCQCSSFASPTAPPAGSSASTIAGVALISLKDGPDMACSWSPADGQCIPKAGDLFFVSSFHPLLTRFNFQ